MVSPAGGGLLSGGSETTRTGLCGGGSAGQGLFGAAPDIEGFTSIGHEAQFAVGQAVRCTDHLAAVVPQSGLFGGSPAHPDCTWADGVVL